MGTTEIFLIAMLLIFALPYAVWRLLGTDHWAPLVVVQIIGGILLGPGVLGAAAPGYYAFVFNPQVTGALNGIAWWAVMMFVWVAGIELDLGEAWRARRETVTTATLALAVPLLAGCAAAMILFTRPGWIGPHGGYGQAMLGIGMACAVTALPILVLLLDKLAILRAPLGRRMLRYASLDDIAIWGVLALILLDWERMGRQLAFLVAFTAATIAVRWLIKRIPPPDRWAVGLIWLAAAGFAADWSGLHYMVGAFLAGAVLDAEWYGHEAMDRFRDLLLLTVMPVFFLSTGLKTTWSVGGVTVFAAATLLFVAAVGGKLAGVHIASRILGWAKGDATLVGLLLQTKGLILIVFVNILLDKGIITNATFTALLLMAIASTMLTVPLVKPRLARLMEKDAAATG